MKLGIDRVITVFINELECLSVFYTPPDFNTYFNYKQNHLTIGSIYANIDVYSSNLKKINYHLSDGIILDKYLFQKRETEIYAIDFLNSNKCKVISDLNEIYADFQNEAIIFLSNYYYLREIKNPTFIEEHNFMLIGNVYLNIKKILDYFESSNKVSLRCARKMNSPGYWGI